MRWQTGKPPLIDSEAPKTVEFRGTIKPIGGRHSAVRTKRLFALFLDERYFLTVLRYILRNPVKAGICEKPEAYELSSAKDYANGGGLTDTAFAEGMLGREELLRFLSEPNEDDCMDDRLPRHNDKAAAKRFCELVGAADLKDAAEIVSTHPGRYIPEMKKAGLSIRQICRLTGISFGIVRNF